MNIWGYESPKLEPGAYRMRVCSSCMTVPHGLFCVTRVSPLTEELRFSAILGSIPPLTPYVFMACWSIKQFGADHSGARSEA
jgi:hypothetical protein